MNAEKETAFFQLGHRSVAFINSNNLDQEHKF